MSTSTGNSKEETSPDSENHLPLRTLAVKNIIYKGEGNANIVIALPHERKVIRFRKSLPGEVSPDGGGTRMEREVWYARNVVSCFLGPYVQIHEIVRYDANDIAKLSDAIRPLRPEIRRHKEITSTYAAKFPDYTFLDLQLKLDETVFRSRSTFCVEIKPKQGYLQIAKQRFPKCPFCLKQYTKLRKRSIVARSNYCPFDLFSGVKARMKAALKELLSNPQNNLKIFKDGLVVYDQESSPSVLKGVLDEWFWDAASGEQTRHVDEREKHFCNLIYTTLTRPFAQKQLKLPSTFRLCNFPEPANYTSIFDRVNRTNPSAIARVEHWLRLTEKNCNFDNEELPKNCVLERIRNMQQLSYVDTAYIYHIYSKFASSLNDDMIYSDLWNKKLETDEIDADTIFRTPSNKLMNTVIQRAETIKGTYFQTLLKSTVARKYIDNCNGHHNTNSNCTLPTNTDRNLVNGGFVSQTEISHNLDSLQSFYGNKRLHNRKVNDDDDDERKANTQITAEHLSMLQNYLLFTTARDCSILMSFRELHPESASRVPAENIIKLSEQRYFVTSVRVSDLDPKSVHSIEKHRKRDADIFNSVISLEKDILFKNKWPVEREAMPATI